MKLPQLNKVRREELKDAPGWVDKLIDPINLFMEQLFTAVDKNIDIDNLDEQVYENTIKITDIPLKIRLYKSKVVSGIVPLQVLQVSPDFTPIGSAIFFEWVQEDNETVTIQNIVGIVGGQSYKIRIRIV